MTRTQACLLRLSEMTQHTASIAKIEGNEATFHAMRRIGWEIARQLNEKTEENEVEGTS